MKPINNFRIKLSSQFESLEGQMLALLKGERGNIRRRMGRRRGREMMERTKQRAGDPLVIIRVRQDDDMVVVLGSSPQQRHTANVDCFDGRLAFEVVQIANHQLDGRQAMPRQFCRHFFSLFCWQIPTFIVIMHITFTSNQW